MRYILYIIVWHTLVASSLGRPHMQVTERVHFFCSVPLHPPLVA